MPPRIKASWWQSVVLVLEPRVARGARAEVFRGALDEAVNLALERPYDEQRRLVLLFVATGQEVGWAEIAALADRPDFPAVL